MRQGINSLSVFWTIRQPDSPTIRQPDSPTVRQGVANPCLIVKVVGRRLKMMMRSVGSAW